MRAVEFRFHKGGGTIAERSTANHGFDGPVFGIDATDRVVLGVGEVDMSIETCRDPFGTVQGGFSCGATVSGKPFFPAAGLMLDPVIGEI